MRNKIRRRMKECMRELLVQMVSGESANLIFIARAPIVEIKYAEMRKEMRYLLKKAGLFTIEKNK